MDKNVCKICYQKKLGHMPTGGWEEDKLSVPSNSCANLLQGRAVNETKWLPLLSHWRQFGRGFPGNANLVSHWAWGEMVLLYTHINSLDFVFSSAVPSVSAAVIIVAQSGLCSLCEHKLSDKTNKSEMASQKFLEGHRLYSNDSSVTKRFFFFLSKAKRVTHRCIRQW